MENSYTCQQCNDSFLIDAQDRAFYAKIDIPLPTFCPRCRLIRRLLWRNERTLYQRACALCGKSIVALYSDDKPWKVYCPPCYYSDAWDPMRYGRSYDFSRPFFGQLHELMKDVPWPSLAVDWQTLANSEYNNQASNLKNCYLVSHAGNDEDCLYSSALKFSKDSSDITLGQFCELSYEGVNLFKCYRTFFSQDCENCYEVWFSKNLTNCTNCFGSANLKNKQYHIFNKPYQKEEYIKKIRELKLSSYTNLLDIQKKTNAFLSSSPQKSFHGRHNVNVSGDYIYYSKNVHHSFEIVGAGDSKYCHFLDNKGVSQCYDYTDWGGKAELVYESVLCGDGMSRVKFCYNAFSECRDIEYSLYPQFASSHLFGCVGLKNKKYCILNKQYAKEEFETLREKIIADMNVAPYKDKKGRSYAYGEFFPPAMSLFTYNETTAQEYFPLDKRSALAKGYQWKEEKKKNYSTTMQAAQIADDISDAANSILKEIIACNTCKKGYRIIPRELSLHKNFQLPLPRKCPSCRHQARIQKKGPLEIYNRTCDKCGIPIVTSFNPKNPVIIWCEGCYRKEYS